ncbi:MerR family transcriptional regulator [Brachybacterium hainanense]|uniref:Protein phosphatase 2C domain-containing protein n=1 Tax=Brachybacterium hainanense TaxID=1541174 RepID=A0ABV6RDN4_9MICO
MHERMDPEAGPEGLLSIGRLAEAGGLSAKALRMYDESGLLVPARVDPFTGYRAYHPDQIARARRIAALRGIGMGLARIRIVCDLSPAGAAQEIRSWWSQEQADARSRGDAVRRLLADLEQTSQEDAMPDTTTTTRPAARGHARARRLRRPELQDAAVAENLPQGRLLLAVADGFGDARRAPDALEALAVRLRRELGDGASALEAMRRAWEDAAATVPKEGDHLGTTLTAALIDGEELVIAHIGDTRAVLVRGGSLFPITQDHTLIASLVAAGRLSAEEAAAHPQRATLNRALAPGAPREPDLLVRTVRPGDRLVLMSDGVHAVLDAEQVAGLLTVDGADPEHRTAEIVDAAIAAGGEDDAALAIADLV